MNRHNVKELIVAQLDPEEVVDVLSLGTEQLLYHLDDVVNEAIENGLFDYLLMMHDGEDDVDL